MKIHERTYKAAYLPPTYERPTPAKTREPQRKRFTAEAAARRKDGWFTNRYRDWRQVSAHATRRRAEQSIGCKLHDHFWNEMEHRIVEL